MPRSAEFVVDPNDYSALRRELAGNMDRANGWIRTIGDLADERRQAQMKETSADKASERRLKESKTEGDQQMERRLKEEDSAMSLRLLQQASSEGLPVEMDKAGKTTAETAQYVSGLRKKDRERQAQVGWDLISAQREKLEGEQKDALTQLNNVAGDPGNSNPATRREALRAALADPSSKNISDELRANLQKIANSDADPLKAVNEAVTRIQETQGGNSGLYTREGTRFNNASAFLAAYNAALAPKAAAEHQAQFLAANERYTQTIKSVEDLNHQMAAHLNTFGAHMDQDTFKGAVDTLRASPGAKPQLFPPGQKTTDTPPVPAPEVTAPPVTTTGAAPTVGQTFDQSGLVGVAKQKGGEAIGQMAGVGRNILEFPLNQATVLNANLFGGNAAAAPTKQQILANRAQVDANSGKMTRLLAATGAELSALPQYAKSLGISDADIAKGSAGVQANDPVAIASFNRLLLMYRQAQQGGSGGIPMPSSAPSGAGISAPPVNPGPVQGEPPAGPIPASSE